MKIAIYPGSFDPITNGHLDIINRASKLFDKVYVLVSVNIKKQYMFSVEERVELIKHSFKELENVEVVSYDSLVVDFAKTVNAKYIIRGVRNHNDFDSEQELAYFNKKLYPEIETILLFPSFENMYVSSSIVKELVNFNQDVSEYVSEYVNNRIREKRQ